MAIVFRAGNPNFPANQDKLNLRLEEIEQLINNDKKVPKVNIKFSEAAFKLMEDCALITEGNLQKALKNQKALIYGRTVINQLTNY